MPTTLDVQLRPATEHDARSMAVIKLSTPSPFSRIIDNLPDTSDCIPETTIIKHEQDIRRRIAAPNGLLSVASVQLPDGKEDIAGWGMWRLFDTPQPIENEPVIDVTGDDPDRLAKRCLSDFKHALVRGRNTYTAGTRNIRLCNLFTHPSYRRKGIGGKLIQQGTDLADKKGYIAYLEASPMAKPLYEKHGFVEVDSFTLNLSEYAVTRLEEAEPYTTSLMIRRPVALRS